MRVEGRPGPAKGTRGLLALVVALGLLIAVGTAVVLITILHRALAPAPRREPVIAAGPRRTQVSGVLPVPPGTRIGGLALARLGRLARGAAAGWRRAGPGRVRRPAGPRTDAGHALARVASGTGADGTLSDRACAW